MHHDSSLSSLFVRRKRSKFVAILSRYWDLFLSTWEVMLHGNPARAIFGGINIAASGELGVGVGEEDRGSGEREVLEGLVGRIEGLVDLVVSKFGDYDPDSAAENAQNDGEPSQWLGTGQEPGLTDGAIFLGTGTLSRKSLRDLTQWMEDLYTWGDHAYGVIESPTSIRRARRKAHKDTHTKRSEDQAASPTPDQQPKSIAEQQQGGEANVADTNNPLSPENDEGRLDKMVSYLKLGYGTYWSLPGGSSDASKAGDSSNNESANPPQANPKKAQPKESVDQPKAHGQPTVNEAAGHYLIGLKGEIEEAVSDGDSSQSSDNDAEHNSRTLLRTVHVELETDVARPEATIVQNFGHPANILTQSQVVGNMLAGYDSHDLNKAKKLRVVVYVNRPFIFTFLFELRTDSLAWDALYRSLHYQLAPLRKPLVQSTKYRPDRPISDAPGANNIYDLIWDPKLLTVHSTIPNIPDNYLGPLPWSRPDALNTHLHLLSIHAATRSAPTAQERTQKTQRGWWIVWTRLLDQRRRDETPGNLSTIDEAGSETAESEDKQSTEDEPPSISKEIFLIRRASDHVGFRGDGGAEGAGRLAQGIGVDTRRYVEELLNLL